MAGSDVVGSTMGAARVGMGPTRRGANLGGEGAGRWEQYRLGTNIRAWLFTILYHVFVSRRRRIDAREVQPSEEHEGWSLFEAVGDADPEGRFFDSFLDDEITRAIDALPDEYRAAV